MKASDVVERARELLAERAAAKRALERVRGAVIAAENELSAAEEAQVVVQVVAETIQEEAHSRIAGVVTRCLATVFDDPYEFRISFDRARGRTEANLSFERDGHRVYPMEGSGGGAVDVAAFAARLASMMYSRPSVRRLVVLYEPFKFVSEQYRPAVRGMLERLASDLEVQVIMVTHIKELVCGHVIEVEKSS